MINYIKLKEEVTIDPILRGYVPMTNQQVLDSLTLVVDRNDNASLLTGDQMFTATNATDWNGLTDAKRQMWVSFTRSDIDPFAAANVAFVKWIFGTTAPTVTNLAALRTKKITRAVELNLGDLKLTHIANVRA